VAASLRNFPSGRTASSVTVALPSLRATCTNTPLASDFRIACRTTCAQNLLYPGQLSHSAAQRLFASEVKATDIPKPYRHQANSGSPFSVDSTTSHVGLGRV